MFAVRIVISLNDKGSRNDAHDENMDLLSRDLYDRERVVPL